MNTTPPPFRKLRAYAFDPSLSAKIDTAFINAVTYKVLWEEQLDPGPIGEYVEVIDYDPTTASFYTPVDLDHRHILAQDGLSPSESNPQFHQQMCYAVAMTTIKNFEKALGRKIIWSPHEAKDPETGRRIPDEFVRRLRIYPHAFRDANAFYSPQKKSLLFGYFSSRAFHEDENSPNSLVFTCLSHDIIAHETTHAILDGIHSKYIENTNPDVLAFHEAIADIVALFQHFTFREVLAQQVALTRGDLSTENLLGQLAQEFGNAIGNYGALRDAIGSIDPATQKWKPRQPDPDEYKSACEPHARGAVLVSALFETFLSIYKKRTEDLLRISTGGTGILPEGCLHPDLVNRLAQEASKSAQHVLTMCIRALDYCPPVDITFGDYLRAIITADYDLEEEDSMDYRLAFIEAFRKRGIYPAGTRNLSEDSLRYTILEKDPEKSHPDGLALFLREFSNKMVFAFGREQIFNTTSEFITGKFSVDGKTQGLHSRIAGKFSNEAFEKLTGLVFRSGFKEFGIRQSKTYGSGYPSFSIRSLKLASRVGPSGNKCNQAIITLTQRAHYTFTRDDDGKITFRPSHLSRNRKSADNSIILYGGATLIYDLDNSMMKYCITKPLLDPSWPGGKPAINTQRLNALYSYQFENNSGSDRYRAYFTPCNGEAPVEPFSFLHRS